MSLFWLPVAGQTCSVFGSELGLKYYSKKGTGLIVEDRRVYCRLSVWYLNIKVG